MKIYLKVLIISSFFLQSYNYVNDGVECSDSVRIYVPDEETAKKIAEAIWLPIYGERIYNQKPYHATLLGDSIWYVYGTLGESHVERDNDGNIISLKIVQGGVASIYFNKYDCKILSVSHSK